MMTEISMRKGQVYSVLRNGFRVLPQAVRTRALAVLNWVIWKLRSVGWNLDRVSWSLQANLVRPAKTSLRLLGLRIFSYTGRFRCSVCANRVRRFNPLPAELITELHKHGFKYTMAEAETCNGECYSCPFCGAADRERLYALYLRNYFSELAPNGVAKLVDFAPSPPLSSFIKKLIADSTQRFSYRTADLFAEGVDDKVDIMDMKIYGDNSVDYFICSHVLEHVMDDRKALKELCRILKVGGRGILVVPIVLTADEIDEDPSITDPAERWRRFGQDDHVRLYSKEGFLSRVQQAGFKVHQLGASHFGLDTFRKHGITDQSVLYVVEKT